MSVYEFILDRSENCLSINRVIWNIFESDSNDDCTESCCDVSEKAREAFTYLMENTQEMPDFSLENKVDFLLLENCFFNIIQTAFETVKNTANNSNVFSIEILKEYLDSNYYQYFAYIFELTKAQFDYWLRKREGLKACNWNPNGYRIQFCSLDHINKIRELSKQAVELMPSGELANRMALISDLRIIYNLPWTIEMGEELEEIISNLPSYNDRTQKYHIYHINSEDSCLTFIKDAHCDEYFYQDPDIGSCDWFYGFDTLPFYSDNDYKFSFSEDDVYHHIMSYPAHINSNYQTIEQYASSISKSQKLKQKNNELLEINDLLQKAQAEKKQIIAEFAHTYGNMQATTLQDIGTELLSVDDELLHEWGRKIMVEYAIKQNLTKEVEMLKLQFEDQSSKLIQKMKDSLNSYEGKTITALVSDALQRCFMSLLYGETRSDKSKRKLFFGSENNIEMREALQDSFEQSVLVGEQDMLNWLNEKSILDIPISISGIWKTLCFDDGGYAALLITNWITELLTNAIKYADKSKPISMSFSHENDMLIITISDIKEQSAVNIHGTQQGISSIIASIRRLNLAVECTSNTDELEEDSDSYNLKLFLSSKVLIG